MSIAGLTALHSLPGCWPTFTTMCHRDDDCPADFRCDLQAAICVPANSVGDAGAADAWNDAGATVDRAGRDAPLPDARPPDLGEGDHFCGDAMATDSSVADSVAPDAGALDSAAHDRAGSDRAAGDTAWPDTCVSDRAAPDCTRPDTRLPDTRLPDTRQPDTQWPDATLPDTRQPDTQWPDATQPDSGTRDTGSGCPGCFIDQQCRALGEHNPRNPCEWCAASDPEKWTKIDGYTCYGNDRYECDNGREVGLVFICPQYCDAVTGDCCGNLGAACCSEDPLCGLGLECAVESEICTFSVTCGNLDQMCCLYDTCNYPFECDWSNHCVETCGEIDEACCVGMTCDSEEHQCCNNFCIMQGICLPIN